MYLDRCAVQTYNINVDSDDAFRLQCRKYSRQNTVLAPSVHADVYRMPIPIGFRQCSPFAAVFRDIQYRIDQLKVRHADVPTLRW